MNRLDSLSVSGFDERQLVATSNKATWEKAYLTPSLNLALCQFVTRFAENITLELEQYWAVARGGRVPFKIHIVVFREMGSFTVILEVLKENGYRMCHSKHQIGDWEIIQKAVPKMWEELKRLMIMTGLQTMYANAENPRIRPGESTNKKAKDFYEMSRNTGHFFVDRGEDKKRDEGDRGAENSDGNPEIPYEDFVRYSQGI